MKRRFTILTAAFALLAFLAIPMGMMGQTRESYTATYGVTDLEDMFEDGSSYASANGYWKVPESAGNVAMISIPITQQPTSDISVKFHIATFGSGTNPAATNTTITAVGTESNSNWSGTGVSAYPSSSTYVDGVMTIAMPNNPTTLSGLEITMGVSSGVKIFRLQSITVEYTYGGGTPTPTTYTVTYDCNGGTSGCPENVTGLEAGDEITLADGPVKTDYDFAGWSDGNTTYDEGDTYTVNGNVTFTAQWTEQASGEVHWVLTDLANLTTNDVFVIVGNGYAMTNDNGTNSAPATSAVTITGNEITSTVAANIKWTVSGEATNGYTFYPNGSTTTWLHFNSTSASGNNNNMRVGTGNRKVFVLNSSNYLVTNDSYVARYLSIYNNADWRGYINTNNGAVAISFYKKVTGDVLPPSITANNVSFDYTTTSGEIEYTINNPVENATLIANTNDSWLTLGAVGSTSIPFTCSINAETIARTATVTLSYVNGEATLVTKEVTVTQGAAPVSYTTIPDLFAAATSTETAVYVTFNNWVVSGVSTNGKNVFVTDNNGNGFVIYGSNMSDTYTVGDILSGTAVSCTLKKYNGFAELINLDANDLTITSGGTVSTANVAMADLAGVNTGALVHYDGLTCSVTTSGDNTYYKLSDGTTTIQVYNALYAFDALEDGKTYNITGVYQQYNNTKEILPRSAADIEAAPSIVVAPASVNVNAIGNGNSGSQLYTFSITCENLQVATEYEFGIQFYDATGQNEQESPSWIVSGVGTNDAGYVVNLNIIDNYDEARYAYFKVHAPNNNVEVYSNLVTINQAAAPQQYTLVIHNPEHVTITAVFGTDVVTNAEEADLLSGTEITLTFDVEDGYVLEGYTVLDANDDPVALTPVTGTENSWTFNMPNSNVFVDASAVENVAPAGGNYVRITALDQLTDGSKVIIAARFDEEHTNGYYAMPGETSGKPTGVAFTSEVSGSDEIVPATITSSEDTYYWTVNVTTDGYTFTNANNQMIGYTSGTNFATGGDNTEWTISRETAGQTALVPEYEGFVIRNGNSNGRAFAFNGQAFGAYSTSNMTGAGYNFYLDFFVQPATESISFTVTGYTELQNPDGGYCLIACPFDGVDPDGTGMITADSNYDLYKYDEPTNVWRNYKTHDNNAEPGFNLALGEGYLYANAVTTTITFSGTPVSGTTYDVTLSKTGNATNEGWNLVGNPFKVDAYIGRDFYTMNSDGTDIMTEASTGAIAPLQGVFVEANSPGETLTFTTQAQPGQKGGLTLNLSQGRGTIDRAVVRFGENRNLRKFQLFENSTKLCIAQDGEEYAVISSEAQGEMPVNFKASKNGTYTISINCEDTEFGYLHLIDNMTGADIDLIANPSYSFEANVTDYTSRFKLVFMVDEDNNNNNDNFAFVSNGQIILNGQGTVEVYDLNGRMISRNNDVTSIATDGMANGVYMIRLTNGSDVKTQKIVVK